MKRRWLVWLASAALLASLAACARFGGDGAKGEGDSITPEDSGLEGVDAGGFVWRREGGIVGFCDVVTASGDGRSLVARCTSDPPEVIGEVELTPTQIAQLDELTGRLASFENERSDPATADALTIAIDFSGRGSAQPSDDDLAAIDSLALSVLRTAGSP